MTSPAEAQWGPRGVELRKSMGTADITRPQWLRSKGFGVGAIAVSAILTIAASLWWLVEDQASFMVLGWAAALIVSLPFVSRGASLQSPWSLLALSVYIGCALRGTFIAFGVEGPSRSLETLFLLGQPPSYFIGPSLLHLAGLAFLTAGYCLVSSRAHGPRALQPSSKSRRQRSLGRMTPLVVAVFALVGFAGFALYVQATGGMSWEALSAKRSTINGLNLSDDYSSHGGLRLINGFGAAAFWVAVAYVGSRRRAGKPVLGARIIVPALAVNAVLLAFYSSSRSEAAFILLVGVGIHVAYGGRSSRKVLVGVVALVLTLLAIMTGLRASSEGSEVKTSLADSALEAFVYNRNFGDMQNTSHIVQNVPDVIPYQQGETMVGYLVAPVPRSIWADKPIVSTGPLIGVYIYGNARSGVPPGLFGDFYLNFGAPAVPLGGLFTGFVLGWVERWRNGLRLDQQMALLVYCTVGFRLGLLAMNQGVAFALFKAVTEVVPVVVVVALSLSSKGDGRSSDIGKPIGQVGATI